MKTLNLNLLYLVVLVLGITSCKTLKEISAEDQALYDTSVQLIDQGTFLLTGDDLTINDRHMPPISSTTNFIRVIGKKATVQVSPGVGGGPNGVGGFTVNGEVSGYKVQKHKNGNVIVSFHVNAPVGSCDLRITLFNSSNRANAVINSSFFSGRAQMLGKVQAVDNSVFKGTSIFNP